MVDNHSSQPRMLVADDEQFITNLFQQVLSPRISEQQLSSITAEYRQQLSGNNACGLSPKSFDLAIFQQAEQAVDAVRQSLAAEKPFSVAFLDVRMPPGRDGIWAAEQIRALDPNIEIVIVTGYPDIDSREILQRIPPVHKLLYLQKPFHVQEIYHFASALSAKWQMEKELHKVQKNLENRVDERTRELTVVNQKLRNDIIKRKQAEKALKNSVERWRMLFERAGDGILILDAENTRLGKVMAANRAAADMHGYPPDKLLELSKQDLEPAEETNEFSQWLPVILKGHWFKAEVNRRRKDGSIFPVEMSAGLLQYGNRKHIITFDRDITERKRAEESLREREQLLRLFVHNTPAAVAMCDRQMCYLAYSRRWLQDYRLSDQNLLGKSHYEIFPEVPEQWKKEHQRCLQGEIVKHREEKFPRADGTVDWVRRELYPWHSSAGEIGGLIYFTEVITKQKQAEEENRKLEFRLQQAQKMEAIGTLAGGIAHDFNNILGAMLGYTELALIDTENNTPLQKNLHEVLTAGNRAKDLIRQILTFSRQTEQILKPIQLKLIVKEALNLIRASLPATVEIQQDLVSDSCVMADPTQMHQILVNLCTNAAYAMRDRGGMLKISLHDVQIDQDYADKDPDLEPGFYLELTVSDTGPGMSAQVLDRIFEPFFTTKEKHEGTGMGLAVVHGIVKSHDGKILVYSEPQGGSTFRVYLPAIQKSLESKTRKEEILPTGSEHILYIDDEPGLVDVGKQILESLGYEVTVRTSSIEALELFKNDPDRFDLVITDMTMPNLTGEDLAREMIQIRPEIPVILCTGFSPTMDEGKALGMGIRAFISKPVLKKGIAKTVRMVLDEPIGPDTTPGALTD